MNEAMDGETDGGADTRRSRRLRAWLGGSATVMVLAAGSLWLTRTSITETLVQRYLAERDVAGSYKVTALSPSRIALTDIRLGRAPRPDFTADRAVIALRWNLGWPSLAMIELDRPTLRARLTSDGISFGSLDALIPESDEPFALPDFGLQVRGGRLIADTPIGAVTGSFQGQGPLADGFRGRLQVEPTTLAKNSCKVEHAAGVIGVRTDARSLLANADLTTMRIVCEGVSGEGGRLQAAIRIPETLDLYRGDGRVELATGAFKRIAFGRSQARVDFAGSANAIAGIWSFDVRATHGDAFSVAALSGRGSYEAMPRAQAVDLTGRIEAASAALAPAVRRQLLAPLPPAVGSPVEPLVASLRASTDRALRQFSGRAAFTLTWRERQTLTVRDIEVRSTSGARLVHDGDMRVDLASHLLSASGQLSLRGDGMPETSLQLTHLQSGADPSAAGRLTIAPWRGGSSAIAVQSLGFAYRSSQLTANGLVQLSGPIAGGRIDGLRLPLDLVVGTDDGLTIDSRSRCLAPSFDALRIPGLVLARTRLTLCPTDGRLLAVNAGGALSGGVNSRHLTLTGGFGADRMPAVMSADSTQLRWSGTLAAPAVDVRVAALRTKLALAADRPIDVSLANLTGQLRSAAAGWVGTGSLAGGAFRDPTLPIAIDRANAHWSLYADGALRLTEGDVRVADTAERSRFAPLRLTDIDARLADGVLTATADTRLAVKGNRLAKLTLRHEVGRDMGSAEIDARALRFDDDLQPFEISELARGVIEEVKGPVAATGTIRWSPDGMTSSGRVVVTDLSMATAALGPITGLTTTIEFDDLLALTTPPRQTLSVATLNPGVAVENGVAQFQLLGGGAVAIESARWPFSGGTLILAPMQFRPGAGEHRFTLQVRDLDAAQFLQRMDFKNLHATGRFDGELPVIFTGSVGRIENGRLVAQPGGGTIQYVGEIGGDSLGAAARFAFDALKSMKYDALTLELDGELAGELVTGIRFSGTNQAPVRPAGGVPVAASNLPFKFNVTVRAPFQKLLNSAASFNDAGQFIRDYRPVDVDAVPGVAPASPQPPQ